MIEKLSLTTICLMILIVSFMGFVTENIWLAFTRGYVDNRNMCLPFLLGYGLLMMFVYYCLGLPENRTAYFFQSAAIVMIGELLLGCAMEKICHFEWWNYSWLPLHITKYTSIPTTILFAIIITTFMDRLFLPLATFFESISSRGICLLAVGLILLLVADMTHSFYKMYQTKGLYNIWYVSAGRTVNNPAAEQRSS